MISKRFLVTNRPEYKNSKQRAISVNIPKKNFKIDKRYLNLGNKLTFFVKTYGCQSNFKDTENISGILKQLGFKPSSDILKADLIILNTCAIRENAEKKCLVK